MSRTTQERNHSAITWLKQLSQTMDADPELVDAMPIEDVRAELRARGANVTDFHVRLAKTLILAQLTRVQHTMIKWMSELFQPQWAGQFATAADLPEQKYTFKVEQGGVIAVICSWKPQSGQTPAYLDLAWKADTIMDGEFWCVFVEPDTKKVLAEVSLGDYREGGKYLTSQSLGFDPSTQPWAITVLMKERTA
jgi:hypothetical protein